MFTLSSSLVELCKVSLLKAFQGPQGTQRLKDLIQMKSSVFHWRVFRALNILMYIVYA